MSLFGAMTASVSGIGAQGQAISVISDNLANTNTIGYKASRTLFSQMVTNSGASGTAYNSGGVGTAVARSQNTQGSFITSTSKTDLAISGNGFFVVADSKVNTTQTSTYYTRAGSFSEDKEGYLVNPDGFYLQGWRTESDGSIINIQEPTAIELQSVGVSAKETQNFSIKANLNNTETVNDIYANLGAQTIAQVLQSTINDPTLADYVADVRVYDAQGGARDMTIHFTKRAANTWDWQLVADSTDIQAGTGLAVSSDGTRVKVGGGTLVFNTNGGSLKSATSDTDATGGTGVRIQWANGVDASDITMNFGQFTGGQVTTVANQNTSGVLAASVETGTLSTTNTYSIAVQANGDLALIDGAALPGTVLDTIPAAQVASTGTRELYFATAGVRVTVSDNFDEQPAAGPAAVIRDSFTVANKAKRLDGIGTDGMTQLAAAYNTGGVNQDG
ncbi:MAG: hypothetical protein DI585_06835, partial [Pseudomonas fluorescens]